MCSRFSITLAPTVIQLEFDLEMMHPEVTFPPFYYPSSAIPVVIDAERRNVEFFYWGLIPPWAKDIRTGRKLFNARSETLAEKPSFKNAFLRRRCLIPATGYQEWRNLGNRKIPYAFSLKNEKPFFFAGIWEYWMDAAGNEVYSAAIITCAANSITEPIHDRMPVILDKNHCWRWMEDRPAAELQQLMMPFDSALMKVAPVEKPANTLFDVQGF